MDSIKSFQIYYDLKLDQAKNRIYYRIEVWFKNTK